MAWTDDEAFTLDVYVCAWSLSHVQLIMTP